MRTPKNISEREFIILMAVLMSVVAISIDALLPALGVIGEYLKVKNENHTQYIISAIFVGMAIGQVIAGPLSDAKGRIKVLFTALVIYALGSLICLFSNSLQMMLAGRFIQGLGAAGPYISCMSIVRDKYHGRVMAKIMSLIMMIFISIPVIAPALGQAILILTSWKFIFALYIFYSIGVLIWLYFRLDETLPPEKRVPFNMANFMAGVKEVFSNRKTLFYTISMGLVFGSLIGDLNSARQVFQEQFGVGKMFVVYFGLQALLFGASSLLNAKLVEKIGMHLICERALMLISVMTIIFLAAHLFFEIKFWMFFFYGMVLLFCVGLLFGNLNALALDPLGHIAGLASAVIGFTSSLISTVLGTFIGQMYNGTLVPLLWGFFILNSVAFVLIKLSERKD